jgi:peptide/nickel transport system substrate-binding protein
MFQAYDNPKVDALIEEGAKTVDPVRRQEIYYELQKIYVEDVPGFMLYQPLGRHYEREWVQGWAFETIGGDGTFWPRITKAPGAPNPDTYIIASIGEPETFDPGYAYDDASGNPISAIYEPLVDYELPTASADKTVDPFELTRDTSKFRPVLAEEVPTLANGGISADGMTYTLKIRKGIKFSNGNDLTPEDVEYTFERLMVMDAVGGPQWMHYEALLGTYGSRDGDGNIVVDFADIDAAVEVDGDNVVFKLVGPFPPFINILMTPYGSGIIDKDWAIENGCWDGTAASMPDYNNPEVSPINDIAMGTGPYILDRWEKEVDYWLVRNDNYWGEPAKLKRIQRLSIDEWSTRKLMFQQGDADNIYVPTQYIEELEGVEGIRVVKDLPSPVGVGLFMTFDVQP